jgi:hypothetical protein
MEAALPKRAKDLTEKLEPMVNISAMLQYAFMRICPATEQQDPSRVKLLTESELPAVIGPLRERVLPSVR